jgi:GINS complex subunit 1
MGGSEALQLVREALRQGRNLEPYNDEIVRSTLQNINNIFAEGRKWSEELESSISLFDEADQARIVGGKALIDRNKRILLAYHTARLDCISAIASSVANVPAKVKGFMIKSEVDFYTAYQDNLRDYEGAFRGIIDVSTNQPPPRDLFIQIRVNRDCGVIQTESGQLQLSLNSFHFVQRSDVQGLIDQGLVTHVK